MRRFDSARSWHSPCGSHWSSYLFTYLRSNTLAPAPVCASEMQCRTFCQIFLLKTKYHLHHIFYWDVWGCFFLWEVKSLIKASWKKFMIERKVGWLKGKKKKQLEEEKAGKINRRSVFQAFWLWPTLRRTICITIQYSLPAMPLIFYLFYFIFLKCWWTHLINFEML